MKFDIDKDIYNKELLNKAINQHNKDMSDSVRQLWNDLILDCEEWQYRDIMERYVCIYNEEN